MNDTTELINFPIVFNLFPITSIDIHMPEVS